MGLSGSDNVSLTDWFGDLTYDEVHAFVGGVGVMFTAVLLWSFGLTQLATAAFVFAFAGVMAAFKAKSKRLSKRWNRIIPTEPWYYLGGLPTGAVLASAVVYVVVTYGPA